MKRSGGRDTAERQDPRCVDLRDLCGAKFRLSHDPIRQPGQAIDPWLLIVRCRTGATIYPFSDSELCVEVDGHRNVRKRLEALDLCQRHQDGDDFGCWRFSPGDLKAVARIVRPYRRRQLTPEQRAAAIARLQNLKNDEKSPKPPIGGQLNERTAE